MRVHVHVGTVVDRRCGACLSCFLSPLVSLPKSNRCSSVAFRKRHRTIPVRVFICCRKALCGIPVFYLVTTDMCLNINCIGAHLCIVSSAFISYMSDCCCQTPHRLSIEVASVRTVIEAQLSFCTRLSQIRTYSQLVYNSVVRVMLCQFLWLASFSVCARCQPLPHVSVLFRCHVGAPLGGLV